mmetsp:Transcript_1543/g.3985  ORF Transcript_1543/g.3985 Transcript_1543/m.3985 type:complete len:236 (-) Transcript_1543:145-852(-)
MGKGKSFKSHRNVFGVEDEQEWDIAPPPLPCGPAPVLFWKDTQDNGYLSNWYLCNFTVDGVQYTSSEQYYMHKKALTFDDREVADQILGDRNPKRVKALGQDIKHFKAGKWKNRKQVVMSRALEAKFSQNPELRARLLETHPKRIAEASPSDTYWGIGLKPSDHLAQDPSNWKGGNALGKLLEELRQKFMDESQPSEEQVVHSTDGPEEELQSSSEGDEEGLDNSSEGESPSESA